MDPSSPQQDNPDPSSPQQDNPDFQSPRADQADQQQGTDETGAYLEGGSSPRDTSGLDPTNVYKKSPESVFRKLTSPFRRHSSEKIKSGSEEHKTPDGPADSPKATSSESKKKKTPRKKGGMMSRSMKKFDSLRGRKKTALPSTASVDKEQLDEYDEESIHDDSGSLYGSVEDVETSTEVQTVEGSPPPSTVDDPPPTDTSDNQNLPDITLVATDHPVSTLPFAISTWKPKKEPQIEKPVETIGPEDSLRKRITADESNDSPEHSTPTEDEKEPLSQSVLSKVVTLAQSQLAVASGQDPLINPPISRGPSPIPAPPPVNSAAEGDGKAEETQPDARPSPEVEQEARTSSEKMGPHGDLIQPDPSSTPPLSVVGMTAPLQQGPDARKEHLYKILVIGELGTGKTSIIKRYVHQFFSQHYRATIGVDFALKVMTWDEDTTVRLQLWDIAGQERFGNMTRVYYKEAVGAFIVFDCSRPATFDAIMKWKNDLDSKVQLPDGTNVPCVLLANKCDLHKEGLINNPQAMEDYCRDKGFVGWFETSAKENINIEEATRALVRHILRKDKIIECSGSFDDDRLTIVDDVHAPQEKKCAC